MFSSLDVVQSYPLEILMVGFKTDRVLMAIVVKGPEFLGQGGVELFSNGFIKSELC